MIVIDPNICISGNTLIVVMSACGNVSAALSFYTYN